MAEPEKRGFFSRLIGRRGAPNEAPPADEAATPPADEAAQSATETDREGSPGGDPTLEAVTPPLPAAPAEPLSTTEASEAAPAADVRPDEGPPAPAVVSDEPPAATAEPAAPEPAISEPAVPEPASVEAAPAPRGFLARLKEGLARSSAALGQSLGGLLTRRKLDAATLEELEDALIEADLGVDAAMAVIDRLRAGRYEKGIGEEELRSILAEEIELRLAPVARPLVIDPARKPHVVLVIGVNGSGKTTTIGKIAARLTREGKRVMLAAGDTFRAAAIEQLKIWGERTGAPVVARPIGADAAGLVFDAMAAARAEGRDVLLVDTAGRLQNRGELMAELEKVVRVIRKQDPTAPHDVLLVLDATTGQNALQQVEIFRKVAGVTGLAMTKLDGTARGGILVAIAAKHDLPVHFVGVGEGVDDLSPFDAGDFARAIAGFGR